LEAVECGDERDTHVKRPYLRVRQQGVDQEQRGQQAQPRLAEKDHAASIDDIRQRAAVQAEQHERDQLGRN
jgi:hypothetical protein